MKRKEIEYITMVMLMIFFLLVTFVLVNNLGIRFFLFFVLSVYAALTVSNVLTGYSKYRYRKKQEGAERGGI